MKALSFEGSGVEYFKIWIVNILLIIITLGLYYPWAKVRNQRYFYANSTLEDRGFEYHATGKQLFVGYLIAMALFIAYIVIKQVSPIGSGIVVILLFLAFPWIIWRSLMFNMRMISFSNVRFSFAGKLANAYVNFMLLPLALLIVIYALPIIAAVILIPQLSHSMSPLIGGIIIILVIAIVALAIYLFAFMKKRNTSYIINGYRYGQGRFSTRLETNVFVKIALKTLGLSLLVIPTLMLIIAILAIATIGFDALVGMKDGMNNPEVMQEIMTGSLVLIIGVTYLGMILASFIIFAYSHTRQRSYIFSRSRLDKKVTFASTLTLKSLAWVMASNLLIVIISLGLALPWVKVRMARLMLENTQVDTDSGFDEYITQQQHEQSPLGEQIGDAFDVDIGIGV
ncbi:MAG: uncharacterized membrane protein YjgN (DUF898 family) [Kiritimatiellia bacterium]|jgi:uncharacterized membrane protein YjgN (DUF898 family)